MDRFKRSVIVIICCGILLSISFVIIFLFSRINANLAFKYPTTDCDESYADYNYDMETYTELAFQEYFNNRIAPDYTKEISDYDYGSYLQCYCDF